MQGNSITTKNPKFQRSKCFQPMEPNKNNTNSMLPTFISFAHFLLNQTLEENSSPTQDARIARDNHQDAVLFHRFLR